MKQIVVLLMIFLFSFSFSDAYIDLENTHFSYNDIIELKDRDIAFGYPDNTFKPDNYITEEELITILFRAANLDACKNFNKWPYDYIELGINNGIIADDSLVDAEEFIEFTKKISVLASIKNFNNCFSNSLKGKSYILEELNMNTQNLTRAEACTYINKLIKCDGKITLKELPCETEIYHNNSEDMDISTIIKSVEVFEYDSYDGQYTEVINRIKAGEHPYLKGRNKNARGNYVIAIKFETDNNSKYGVWTSYKSLKLEGLEVKDAFDIDEISYQLSNCAYDAILVKPDENYTVIAFYIIEEKPEEIVINRDVTTLYNLQTHEYVDEYSFSKINLKF